MLVYAQYECAINEPLEERIAPQSCLGCAGIHAVYKAGFRFCS